MILIIWFVRKRLMMEIKLMRKRRGFLSIITIICLKILIIHILIKKTIVMPNSKTFKLKWEETLINMRSSFLILWILSSNFLLFSIWMNVMDFSRIIPMIIKKKIIKIEGDIMTKNRDRIKMKGKIIEIHIIFLIRKIKTTTLRISDLNSFCF